MKRTSRMAGSGHPGAEGLALAVLALSLSACALKYPGREPTPGWLVRPQDAFAQVQVTFWSKRVPELAGFDVELSQLLGARVEHEVTDPGVRYWANLYEPRHIDLNAVRALGVSSPERAKHFYEMYVLGDWDIEGLTATLRGNGQRFTIDWTPPANAPYEWMFVHWPSGSTEPVLGPNM
jgi:hypothetical protein